MTTKRSISNTFHRIGNSYSHYFNPDHFMGQDALTDIWDAKHEKTPLNSKADFKVNIKLSGFNEDEISIVPSKNTVKVTAKLSEITVNDLRDEYLLQELKLSPFNETFTIPKKLNTKKLQTDYDGKTLKISIPYLPK